MLDAKVYLLSVGTREGEESPKGGGKKEEEEGGGRGWRDHNNEDQTIPEQINLC